MSEWEKRMALMKRPTAQTKLGIHLSAQLRVEAMQLRSYNIGWAAATMGQAANDIDALEDLLTKEPDHAGSEQADGNDHTAPDPELQV